MTHPTEVKLPESATVKDCLTVVQQMLPTHAAGCPAWDYWPCNCGAQPVSLVRLSDAESALKARDAEIERLRGDAERWDYVRHHWSNVQFRWNNDATNSLKSMTLTVKSMHWASDANYIEREIDAAIDQARAEGGEKTK